MKATKVFISPPIRRTVTEDTQSASLDRIEELLAAVFAAEVARELMEAIDFEAILRDEATMEAVDVEKLGDAIGRPLGRLLVRRMVDSEGTLGVASKRLGSAAGGRIASEGLRALIENVEPDTVARLVDKSNPKSTGSE